MMVLLIISGILSSYNLSGLKMEWQIPEFLFAQRTVYLSLKVSNIKRLMPSFSIKICLKIQGLPENNDFILFVESSKSEELMITKIFPRRGVWKISGYYLSSSFPFGFFERKRFIKMEKDIIVYPKIVELYPYLPDYLFLLGDTLSRSKGYEEDFFGLRDWRDGDDRKYIHWKVSAKKGEIIIRELVQQMKSFVTLIVDPYLSELSGFVGENQLEENISMCASLAYFFFNSKIPYKIITPDFESEFDISESHFWDNLKTLALLKTLGKESLPYLEDFARKITLDHSIPILFSVEKDSPFRKYLPKYYEIIQKKI